MGRMKDLAMDVIDPAEWDQAFPQNENFLDEVVEARSYEIQELFIEGHSATEISKIIQLPLPFVQGILGQFGVSEEDCV